MKAFHRNLLFYVILAFVTGLFVRIVGGLEFTGGGMFLQPILLFGGALIFVCCAAFFLVWMEEKNRNQMRKQ